MSMDADKKFGKYKAGKIALYGLGAETEKAVHALENGYEIVGLLDSFRTEGGLYGRRIISFEDALDAGVGLVIVVARPGSCRAIAKKIGDKCRREGIALMDIRGKDLLETRAAAYDFSSAGMVSKMGLWEKIMSADVVSFDLFDTLVMRQTLYTDDVVEYVDCRLREKGIFINGFSKRRLESEKELSRNAAPTLVAIYRDMLGKLGNTETLEMTAGQLADLEWEVDFSMLLPRREVCGCFMDAMAVGKKVYVVSDTYYDRGRLAKILDKCGITEYTDIISSSDYGISKTRGLYNVFRDKSKRHLHIGDDTVADVEGAQSCGIETCRVHSGLELLEDMGMLGLSDYVVSLSDRLKAGMFAAEIFNSPFRPENGGHMAVADAYVVGYLMYAPMVGDFVSWFYENMERQGFQNIWFGARDGYLVKKMYACLSESYGREDTAVYFLTSRDAAVRAGMEDEDDILYVDGMKFSGSVEECLKKRFGIDAGSASGTVDGADGLMGYRDAILENAAVQRENYRRYIDGLNIGHGDAAFFDFVAKGTVQMYVQRISKIHLKGFYFLRLEKENMDGGLDIQSFYESDSNSAIYDDYYILETLLTAPHPSVIGFDAAGRPEYADETRTEKDILCIERVQAGILDHFKTYVSLCPAAERGINRELDEVFLKLVHKIPITDEDFRELVVEDPFFNRMTDITDIL